jgi:hypothetical protein
MGPEAQRQLAQKVYDLERVVEALQKDMIALQKAMQEKIKKISTPKTYDAKG